jgi:hypothetical protein
VQLTVCVTTPTGCTEKVIEVKLSGWQGEHYVLEQEFITKDMLKEILEQQEPEGVK